MLSVGVGVTTPWSGGGAYALVLTELRAADESVEFEMLEGMANHQRRALRERNSHLLLYAPACRKEEFLNAIGYLIPESDHINRFEGFLDGIGSYVSLLGAADLRVMLDLKVSVV